MSDLHTMALAKLQALVDDINVRRERQLSMIPAADQAWMETVREHLISVSYPDETFQGLGCRADAPPEIANRMTTLIADTVVRMIEARLQPAYLPKATADGVARLNAEMRSGKPVPYHSMTDVWGATMTYRAGLHWGHPVYPGRDDGTFAYAGLRNVAMVWPANDRPAWNWKVDGLSARHTGIQAEGQRSTLYSAKRAAVQCWDRLLEFHGLMPDPSIRITPRDKGGAVIWRAGS